VLFANGFTEPFGLGYLINCFRVRIVKSFRAWLNLKDYIRINQLEGYGYSRQQARFFVAWDLASRPRGDPG